MNTKVVNLRREKYDVYIGRAGHGHDGYFGNPFPIEASRRSETLDKFRAYFAERIETDPDFKARVLALKGKTLGCFCKPAACHGDVIAEWIDGAKP